jgi:hypothetical protein
MKSDTACPYCGQEDNTEEVYARIMAQCKGTEPQKKYCKEEVAAALANVMELVTHQKPLSPAISKMLDDEFWSLLEDK